MRAPRPVRVLGRACAAAMLAVLGACGAPASDTELTTLPDGIRISVYQGRTDTAIRKLQVSVSNGTDATLSVTRLIFDSPQFVEPVEWAKDSTTIRPGVTADLPVLLADAACDAADPRATVTLDFELSDGRRGTASAEPSDRINRLDGLLVEDCIAQSVREHVAIEAVTPPRTVEIAGRLAAELDVAITPTGSAGRVSIESAQSTVLLGLADPATGALVTTRPVGLTIDESSAPSVLTLTLVPSLCDSHGIAEDKRGTVFPLVVTTDDGTTGPVFIAATTEVRNALYDYVRAACA